MSPIGYLLKIKRVCTFTADFFTITLARRNKKWIYWF